MREKGSGTYQNVKLGLQEVGVEIEKLDTFMEMGTSEALALAVEQALGVGFVAKMILEKICPGRVAVVEVEDLNLLQPIYLGRQTAYPATSAQAAFWEFVRKAGKRSSTRCATNPFMRSRPVWRRSEYRHRNIKTSEYPSQ